MGLSKVNKRFRGLSWEDLQIELGKFPSTGMGEYLAVLGEEFPPPDVLEPDPVLEKFTLRWFIWPSADRARTYSNGSRVKALAKSLRGKSFVVSASRPDDNHLIQITIERTSRS